VGAAIPVFIRSASVITATDLEVRCGDHAGAPDEYGDGGSHARAGSGLQQAMPASGRMPIASAAAPVPGSPACASEPRLA